MAIATDIEAARRANSSEAPIVVVVDRSAASRTAVRHAVRLARDLSAPVVFVYFRRGPSAALGEPYYQRRLDAEMAAGDDALKAALAVAERAGVEAGSEQLHGKPRRRLDEFARLRGARLVLDGYRPPRESAPAPMVETPARRQAWNTPSQGEVMPYGVYPIPDHPESTENSPAGANLAVRIRTRVRRGRLDRQLAEGTDPATSEELELRAAQLRSTAERARIANALVETLGDARAQEPVTLRPRPQRAVVREAADDILALALRLRDGRPVAARGVAMASRLVDDRRSAMYRPDAGDLDDEIRSAVAALDTARELAGGLQAQAA